MGRREVTALELKQWRSLRGIPLKDIADIYGYHPSTVLYHLQPRHLQTARREQWRRNKQLRTEAFKVTKRGKHENAIRVSRFIQQYSIKEGIKHHRELAAYLQVEEGTLRSWLKKGVMPSMASLTHLAEVTGLEVFTKMRGKWPETEAYRAIGFET